MKSWQVYCEHKRMYRMLVELAREKGWEGPSLNVPDDYHWLIIPKSGKVNGHTDRYVDGTKQIALLLAIRRLETGPPRSDAIFVEAEGEKHEVKFPGDGSAQIGCMTVPREVMETLSRRLKDGGINFGGHHLYHMTKDDGITTGIEWNNINIPIDVVQKIVDKALPAEPEMEVEAKGDPGMLRGFVDALEKGEVGVWCRENSLGHWWSGNETTVFSYRYVAAKVLKAIGPAPEGEPVWLTAEEKGTLRMLLSYCSGSTTKSHNKFANSVFKKLGAGPSLGEISKQYTSIIRFLDD